MEDTIAAISTPIGEGGIGIVRISGDKAINIASKVFKPSSSKKVNLLSHSKLYHGFVIDPNTKEEIDEAMICIMYAPKSYTKENLVEISCHSGLVVLKKILNVILKYEARIAEPGEFTKRAFLNGRIDLTQAEAVCDIIKAKTELSLNTHLNQLKGRLSKTINNIRTELKNLLVNIEAGIDFSENDIELMSISNIKENIKKINDKIINLLKTYESGKILKDGVYVSIVGKPNVGKSSLLNALLNQDRAIVTEIPGTTRDTISECISINGIPVFITDTAGIRRSTNTIEKKGIERTKGAISCANILIWVLDNSTKLSEEDLIILNEIRDKKFITTINKSDLPSKIEFGKIKKLSKTILHISALYGTGLEKLKNYIVKHVYDKSINFSNNNIVTNIRHKKALEKTQTYLTEAITSINNSMSEEFISSDLRRALNYLGEIVGTVSTEDILNDIFNNFCIGK